MAGTRWGRIPLFNWVYAILKSLVHCCLKIHPGDSLHPFKLGGQPGEHPMAPWVDTIQRLSLDELIAQTREEHPGWPEPVIQTWCPAKKRLDPNILSIVNIRGADWPAEVPQLACPTLIVTADPEMGGIITPAIAAQVLALNPLCTVIHIPGAGHHVRFEAYTTYMQNVQAFLQGIE